MGIFDRMGRVISSNFNALLDAADDPRKSVDQTLHEMESQIRAAKGEVVGAVAAEKQLKHKVEELDKELETWVKRAELAVKHEQDDLARAAIEQRRRAQANRDRAEQMRGEQRTQALEMKRELERMEGKLDELKSRKLALVQKTQQMKAGAAAGGAATAPAGGKAFAEFKRMEDQIEGIDASLQAQREVDEAIGLGRGPSGMSAEEVESRFRRLEQGGASGPERAVKSEVEDELQAIKKKVRIGS